MAPRPGSPLHHSRAEFLARLARYCGFALAFLLISLGLGILGYMRFAGLDFIDALFNAAMILTGMGPVDPMQDDEAKIFSSLYAMYGGAVYPAITALILYPLLRRMIAVLHLEALEAQPSDTSGDSRDDRR